MPPLMRRLETIDLSRAPRLCSGCVSVSKETVRRTVRRPRLGGGLVSVNMMFSLLVVARTAPASEDGVQLGGVKRPCVLTVRIAREPAETSGAVEEPGRRQAATRLADGERRDERVVRCRVLLHQALQGFRHLMDGIGWQDLKSLRQLLVGNGDLALRDVLEECPHPCMHRHPIVLSPKFGVTIGHGHLLAPTILIGPDRSTTIRLPLASLPHTA